MHHLLLKMFGSHLSDKNTLFNHCGHIKLKTPDELYKSTSKHNIWAAASPNTLTVSHLLWKMRQDKHKTCTHRFHVVAIHQWVVACSRDRMSAVHNSVWFSARLQAHNTAHTQLVSPSLYSCVYSPHALLLLTYPCWSCSYPQTTYANKGWTIPGNREGWPRVDAITVVHAWSSVLWAYIYFF